MVPIPPDAGDFCGRVVILAGAVLYFSGADLLVQASLHGRVVESADTTDLKSVERKLMRVRFPPRPLYFPLFAWVYEGGVLGQRTLAGSPGPSPVRRAHLANGLWSLALHHPFGFLTPISPVPAYSAS